MEVFHDTATECHLPYGITVLPASRHKWTHPTLTPYSQAATRFTYPGPGGMEGWVDLADLIAPGRESNQRPFDHESDAQPLQLPRQPEAVTELLSSAKQD